MGGKDAKSGVKGRRKRRHSLRLPDRIEVKWVYSTYTIPKLSFVALQPREQASKQVGVSCVVSKRVAEGLRPRPAVGRYFSLSSLSNISDGKLPGKY